MLLHRLAFDDFVGVVMLEGERVFGLRSFVLDLGNLGKSGGGWHITGLILLFQQDRYFLEQLSARCKPNQMRNDERMTKLKAQRTGFVVSRVKRCRRVEWFPKQPGG